PFNDKTAPKSTKVHDATTDSPPKQQDTQQPAHQIIDAERDDTVRQSEQKPQVGDLSKHIDGQAAPEKPKDKN
ncbi:lipase, partial [Staphylococcus aureus]